MIKGRGGEGKRDGGRERRIEVSEGREGEGKMRGRIERVINEISKQAISQLI